MKLRKYLPANIVISLFFSIFAVVLLSQFPGKIITSLTAIIFILFLPGYLLIEVLWPNHLNTDQTWNWLFIFPSSAAIVSGFLLGINYFWEYSLGRMVSFIFIFNTLMSLISIFRYPTQKDDRLKDSSSKIFPGDKNKRNYSGAQIVLACSFLVLIGSITYAIAAPKKSINATEFYVLNTDRTLPTSIENDQQTTDLLIGIFNHEGETLKYTLEIQAVQQSGSQTVYYEEFNIDDEELIEPIIQIPPISTDVYELRLMLAKEDKDPFLDLKILVE